MAGKQGVAGRTAAALADSAKDRATIARRKALMKLRGHKVMCRECSKTFRDETARNVHARKHQRDREQARTKNTRAKKVPHRGDQFTDLSNGKKHRNLLEFNDAARQHAERQERAEKREQERARRTQAANGRAARNGRPQGAPKQRGNRAEEKARWKAHRAQHAAGRLDREGNRTPHTPSPRKVQPRTRVEPKVR